MATRRNAAGSSDRREVIIEAAKALFMENGVKATTVREIGASAGILSGSLYHHFDSKLDIVDEILGPFCAESSAGYKRIAAMEGSTKERLREMSRYAYSLIPKHGAAVRIFYNEYDYLSEQDRFSYLVDSAKEVERRWVDVLKAGIKDGTFRASVEPRMFYRFTGDVIFGAVHWYRPKRGGHIEELADQFTDILLNGITVPPPE